MKTLIIETIRDRRASEGRALQQAKEVWRLLVLNLFARVVFYVVSWLFKVATALWTNFLVFIHFGFTNWTFPLRLVSPRHACSSTLGRVLLWLRKTRQTVVVICGLKTLLFGSIVKTHRGSIVLGLLAVESPRVTLTLDLHPTCRFLAAQSCGA